MEIIALQEYTDKYISLYEGEIRNINEDIADKLIAKNIVAEHTDGSNSSEDLFIVGFNWQYDSQLEDTEVTCDKTFDEIKSFFAKYYNFETGSFTKKIVGYAAPGGFSTYIAYLNSGTGQLTKIAFYFISPSETDTLHFSVVTIDESGISQKTYNYEDAGLPTKNQ